MLDDLNELYQQVILDHSRNPRNFRRIDLPGARHANGYNPLCGDNVTVYLQLENDIIQDASFQGSGCAISKASASILTEFVRGSSTQTVKAAFEQVHSLVTTGTAQGAGLGKLAVFAGVHRFPARVKCAILPWHALLAALAGSPDRPVTTE